MSSVTDGGIRALFACIIIALFTTCPSGGGALARSTTPLDSLTSDSYPTPPQQAWALATTILNNPDGDDSTRLTIPANSARWILKYRWGVSDRSSLLRQLNWLKQGGYQADFAREVEKLNLLTPFEQEQVIHGIGIPAIRYAGAWKAFAGDKGLRGYDLVLYISMCRWGRSIGYLDEPETWRLIMPAARLLQATFPSWQALGRSYLLGREYRDISIGQAADDSYIEWTYLDLLKSPDSLWRTLPWNLDLGAGAPVPSGNSAATSAFLWLFPHPGGLNCFSLTLFQETTADDLWPEASKMLGCPVRILRYEQHDGNTELQGDCVRPVANAHAASVAAKFPLAPLMKPLQRRHINQLFIEISHPVTGASISNLGYSWRTGGFDYHLALQDLANGLPPVVSRFGYSRAFVRKVAIVLITFLAALLPGLVWTERRRRHAPGIAVFRAWFQSRFGVWLLWAIGVTAFDFLSLVRIYTGTEGQMGGFIAALVLWMLGVIVGLTVTAVYRGSLKRGLKWETSPLHLLGRVLREDLWLMPLFLLVLSGSDPQQVFNWAAVVLSAVIAIPIQFIAWNANSMPLGWTIPEENTELYSRVVTSAKKAGREIRRVFIIRRGEPVLRAITMLSAHAIAIPQEFVEQMSEPTLDILIVRALAGKGQAWSVSQVAIWLVCASGILLRLKMPSASGLGGAMILLIPFLAGGLIACLRRIQFTFKGDLETAVLSGSVRTLVSAIKWESQIRSGCSLEKGTEPSCLDPADLRRVQRLTQAYELSFGESNADLALETVPVRPIAVED